MQPFHADVVCDILGLYCVDQGAIGGTSSAHSRRTPGIPSLTEAQADALDTLEALARKHCVEVSVKSGDIRFINNLAILHARDSYEDSDVSKRHMMRLWHRNEDLAWRTPEGLSLAWERVFGEDEELARDWQLGSRDYLERKLRVTIKRPSSCGVLGE
ncbi:hypothetical protein ABW19_dt0205782 [Dactylella cylindrospora]|nr:hypothetical protein ABW19_dt0205782 [Dactylella cylindrospora]